MAKETVIHPNNPSGTLATKIPIPKVIQSTHEYPTMNLALKKNTTPKVMAMMVIKSTNLSNSYLRGVFNFSPLLAKLAIYPNTVLPPILITIPLPFPSLTKVPKKAKFAVSNGLSFVQSLFLNNASGSPVRGELSTFISLDYKILKSAGTLSPALHSTISPGTNSSAGKFIFSPSLITKVLGGKKFLKLSINASDFAVYWKVINPVRMTTAINTMAKYILEGP
mmetsp:Transcript_141279/g.200077  ORF Transcript_141279/g.200077 Transcript_141279/m.200077 type:complete len:223 (-) Transcript_141279:549-1217(-)